MSNKFINNDPFQSQKEHIQHVYQNVVQHYLKPTPLQKSEWLSKLVDGTVYLKLENFNPNGSFKVRGGLNALSKLSEEHKKNFPDIPMKIAAASAGNHAQGVAFAAKQIGCEAHIFLPTTGSPLKRQETQKLGANIYLVGNDIEDAIEAAKAFCEKENAYFVNPFNDENIIFGQATCALEAHLQYIQRESAHSETKQCTPDYYVCGIGGGGLIAGACLYFGKDAHTKIFGVEQEDFNSAVKSLEKGMVVPREIQSGLPTIADGIAVKQIGHLTFKYFSELIDKVVTVSEQEIYSAIAKIYKNEKMVIEGAGVVGVAALLKYPEIFKNKSTIICISGGNIDPDVFARVIEKTKDEV